MSRELLVVHSQEDVPAAIDKIMNAREGEEQYRTIGRSRHYVAEQVARLRFSDDLLVVSVNRDTGYGALIWFVTQKSSRKGDIYQHIWVSDSPDPPQIDPHLVADSHVPSFHDRRNALPLAEIRHAVEEYCRTGTGERPESISWATGQANGHRLDSDSDRALSRAWEEKFATPRNGDHGLASIALAGVWADHARYFREKYGHVITTVPARIAPSTVDWVRRVAEEESGLAIPFRPIEATAFQIDDIRAAYVFYENGLSIHVSYAIDRNGKIFDGMLTFTLSAGMTVPAELASLRFSGPGSAGTVRSAVAKVY